MLHSKLTINDGQRVGFTFMKFGFAKALKDKLDEKEMRPSELSRRTGISRQNISRIMTERPHSVTGAPVAFTTFVTFSGLGSPD